MRGVATAVENPSRPPDGSVRWIQARSFPVEDSQGKLCRIVGIAEDITDRKKMLSKKQNRREQPQNLPTGPRANSWQI